MNGLAMQSERAAPNSGVRPVSCPASGRSGRVARITPVRLPPVGAVLTEHGEMAAVGRFEEGYCKATLLVRPHRVLARLYVSLDSGRATVSFAASTRIETWRWQGNVDLESANRALIDAYLRPQHDAEVAG